MLLCGLLHTLFLVRNVLMFCLSSVYNVLPTSLCFFLIFIISLVLSLFFPSGCFKNIHLITRFKQLYYDVSWYSILHVSCGWVSYAFSICRFIFPTFGKVLDNFLQIIFSVSPISFKDTSYMYIWLFEVLILYSFYLVLFYPWVFYFCYKFTNLFFFHI